MGATKRSPRVDRDFSSRLPPPPSHLFQMSQLEIKNLHIAIGEKEIVKGLSLTVKKGEVHAIMGPNGTGKSTLAKAIAGHPDYSITAGDVMVDGVSILEQEA